MTHLWKTFMSYLPFVTFSLAIVLIHFGMGKIRQKFYRENISNKIYFQLISVFLLLFWVLISLSLIPISKDSRHNLYNLLGIVLTTALTLSSTTFIRNAMSGLMIRVITSFHSGDYIKTGDFFGRVSERSLFHTEIQTLESNLVTIPNFYFISNPVTVVRTDGTTGTIINTTLSLGYDIHYSEIEKCLLLAIQNSGLKDGFVRIIEMGDYSVSYQANGFLNNLDNFISSQTLLKKNVLDSIHQAGIEIVSPLFINSRNFEIGSRFIPGVHFKSEKRPNKNTEELIFDKVKEIETIEELEAHKEKLLQTLNRSNENNLSQKERNRMEVELIKVQEKLAFAIEKETKK